MSCNQVFKQLGRTPGAEGEGGAGADEAGAETAGAEGAGCWGELGAEAGADEAGGATHLVQTVEIEVLVIVETV